ncbi:MAG TPA: sugar phosphate isomerase/epimerase family protein, partial [Anaerolineales bacterium]|nr:sugar phosphate isomerase/epimerase family protein [Anaerolineales bacterium]
EVRQLAITRIKNHIRLAKRFNSLVIIGLIRGITPAGQSKEQSLTYLVDCLQECTATALEWGVRLAFEPLNRYETDLVHTVHEGMELLELVSRANLGLLLDTFHMNIEEPDILEGIQQAGKNILHFHVADSNRWYPGAGHLDFSAILNSLQSTGYTGWISGEFLPLPDAATATQLNYQHLAGILAPLNN